jgi:hypothetical protein
MKQLRSLCLISVAVLIVGSLFVADSNRAAAQDTKLSKRITIQAQAMGTSTQLGRTFNITARVNELSPPGDQAILLEAFKAKGNEGLVNALSKMPAKGRLAITGTLGGDLAYIRRFKQQDGTLVIRMITNRLLRFGEVWADTRTTDYQLSGLEIVVGKDKKATGTLLPAAQLKIDKKGQLEIETYQNPWKLTNIQLR